MKVEDLLSACARRDRHWTGQGRFSEARMSRVRSRGSAKRSTTSVRPSS